MELKMVREADGFRAGVLGAPARVHEDILMGRDASCEVEDVFNGQDGVALAYGGEGRQGVVGWNEEMERKLKI
jgi:proteasome maturation protein